MGLISRNLENKLVMTRCITCDYGGETWNFLGVKFTTHDVYYKDDQLLVYSFHIEPK